MTTTENEAPATQGPAIGQVSESLGIPAPTLRSWERRYGIPVTSRTSGGHRRYSHDELNQLRLMRDEIARGKRAATAALAVRLLLDHAAPEHSRITELLAKAEQKDAAGIRQVLDRSRSDLGLAATIDGVLMPALRQVGAWWESGRCDVPQEHALTETARDWLARFTALQQVDTYDPPILLACGPRDMHTVGLEALAALLAEHERGCRVLGARTSELTLMSATQTTNAAAVVVVSQLHTQRRAAVDSIRAVEQSGTPVFYAGNAFAFPGERRNVPGTYLGGTFSTASVMILDSLKLDAPRPQAPSRAS
ncbi:MAG: MerR family transcriptional regulator [Aeromicrobium sp.]